MRNSGRYWLIHPSKVADKGATYERIFELKDLKRLCQALVDKDYASQEAIEQDDFLSTQVQVNVSGRRDHQYRVILDCELSAILMLDCQITYQPTAYDIQQSFMICPVAEESMMASVPDEYEAALLLESGDLDLLDVIEDELILSLPLTLAAVASDKSLSFGPKLEPIDEPKNNPFEILEQLKSKQ